ncbi:hypothetical protein SK803_00360 [Lentzea sp. BCCO 10_0856]|uniref:Uncharacterized protein n=1 Tax=Lentzea miocenica TaxID=3095431 RepID=A0ABU4SRV8_9PSEU|nr:hypothetical protein [Lentzea sp. BCCO 10_0856]MDX8028635.1 hypothetical protein [Lentzea sp. BCCO 10_0856]
MRPSVVISGSGVLDRRYVPELKDGETIPAASEAIGRELALAGFDLVVFSSSENFIERHVVKGYLGALDAEHPGNIVAHTPLDREVDFDVPAHLKHVLKVRTDPASEWEISYYRALFNADSLLLIGGGRATRIAGVMAVARRMPIVAVACFGASAQTVWRTFGGPKNDVTQDDLDVMSAKWSDDSAALLVKSLQGQLARRDEHLRAEEQREKSADRSRTVRGLVAILSLVLAGLSVVLAAKAQSTPEAIAYLFAGPVLAAVFGAIMRDGGEKSPNIVWTAARGAGAGAGAMLLYVLSQQLTAAPVLDVEAVRRFCWFAVLIGLFAGVTVDLVWARMRNVDVLSDQPTKVN